MADLIQGTPVVIVPAGGIPVTEVDSGLPVSESGASMGTSVTLVPSDGLPVTFAGSVRAPPSTNLPLMDGVASAGTATPYAREDHVHPSDTSRAPLASPIFTGNPQAPTQTAGDNDTSIATTAFVTQAIAASGGGSATPPATLPPLMDGLVAVGTALKYAREDHVHPSDTSRASVAYVDAQDAFKAPLASPAFTGNPQAPTPSPGDADTSIATTAFVAAAVTAGLGSSGFAPLASPLFTGDPKAPTPAPGDNDTSIATTAFVAAAVVAGAVPPATATPLVNSGSGLVGVATKYAHEDHVHPTDSAKENVANRGVANGYPALDASAKVPAAQIPVYSYANLGAFPSSGQVAGVVYMAQDTNKIYRWTGSSYVELSPTAANSDAIPEGATNLYYTAARSALKADLASPVFTGNPTAPTASPGDNDTSIATTAFVAAAVAASGGGAPLNSPAFTGNPTSATTPAAGDNDTSIPNTAFITASSLRYDLAQTLTAAQQTVARKNGGFAGATAQPCGRIALATAQPITSTDIANATTIYWVPYLGSSFPFYDGTLWYTLQLPEVSVATTDTSKNPAAIGVNKMNDWFLWDDAGTVRLTHGPDWTDDLNRSAGTAHTTIDGFRLNTNAITNGPGALRGVYVGTTRSNGTSKLDIKFGSAAAGGGAALMNLWNAFNRVQMSARVTDSTASWTYGTNTCRQMNNSGSNRINFVAGIAHESFHVVNRSRVQLTSANGAFMLGFALDSLTVFDHYAYGKSPTALMEQNFNCDAMYTPQTGYHYVQALEQAESASSCLVTGGAPAQHFAAMFRM